jgi:hypothetical protein
MGATLSEEYRMRVFENRVLKGRFGPKRDQATGGWGKLHNVLLINLYFSLYIIRMKKSMKMRCEGHVASIENCI